MRKLFYIDFMERIDRNGFMYWLDCNFSAGGSVGCCAYLSYAD